MPDADLELVKQALAGQATARRELGRRMECIRRILRCLCGRMGCRLDAADLADLEQDTASRALQKIASFAGRSSLETWLYGVCRHELRNYLRKRGRRPRSLDDLPADERVEPAAAEPVAADASPLDGLLRHLSPREGEVVRLRCEDQLEFGEIARELSISTSTAKTCYYRGLDKLRAALGGAGARAEEVG